MNIEAIQSLGVHDEVPGVAPLSQALPVAMQGVQEPFGQLVAEGLQRVNEQLKTSQLDLQQLALGDAQNLHEVMVRLEESRIAFQLTLQVRNRVLEAYQEVMRMQV
ncbi:MAG TPA: flagellar hook-basal body complex protein FliE [Ramlibacter sp.]|jgi:flagellar hook-basal body complex protein FliE|uniref:flagellar hook-basal body complex protein FliE n=1 Tax=Ramlibacter sp. TaxID=1917967 RepID=UPI002D5151C4|nr:flagellar hook-basal body complex protein FliE [Ramlibacter sp.]HZY20748.1 flagellar hook-basal body complex protein FliE [Ramlibacter sp.]